MLLIINLLIKPFYIFVIEAGVQNKLGAQQYGFYFTLFSFVFLHQFINDPGMQNYNTQFMAENKSDINNYFSRIMGIKLLLLIVLFVLTFSIAFLVGYKSKAFFYIFLLDIVLFLSTLFVLLKSMFSILEKYYIDSWLAGLDKLILIFLIGFNFLFNFYFSLDTFIFIQIITYLFIVGLCFFLLSKNGIAFAVRLDIDFTKKYLKSAMPFAVLILATAAVLRIDHVIIERLLPNGQYQVGQYAAGFRFIDASNMLGYVFGGLLYQMFMNMILEKKDVFALFNFGYRLLFFISLTLLASIIFYLKPLLNLLYNDDFTFNNNAIFYQTLSIFPLLLLNVFGAFILANRLTKQYNLLYIGNILFIVLGNIIFLKQYGIKASAIIFTLSQFIILFGCIYILLKNRKLNLSYISPLHSILVSIAIFGIYAIISYFLDSLWIFEIFLSGILSLLFVFMTRYLTISEFKNI